jgi:hypothetical protein
LDTLFPAEEEAAEVAPQWRRTFGTQSLAPAAAAAAEEEVEVGAAAAVVPQ